MAIRRYKDKYGSKVTLRRNKNGSFNIRVDYDKDSSGSFTITKQDFEAMKDLDEVQKSNE